MVVHSYCRKRLNGLLSYLIIKQLKKIHHCVIIDEPISSYSVDIIEADEKFVARFTDGHSDIPGVGDTLEEAVKSLFEWEHIKAPIFKKMPKPVEPSKNLDVNPHSM